MPINIQTCQTCRRHFSADLKQCPKCKTVAPKYAPKIEKPTRDEITAPTRKTKTNTAKVNHHKAKLDSLTTEFLQSTLDKIK
jgi:hypothetical protein